MQFFKWIVVLGLGLVVSKGVAKSQEQNLSIELVAGLPKPPFIIEENGRGLQLDIIREALKVNNINVNFTHMPLGRNITGFQRINADGIITLPPEYEHPAMYLSKPYITYQNVAVSLLENHFSIETIKDLSDKSIVAFQNARKFLGDDYANTVAYSMDYREIHDQKKQIEMLFLRRAEVIILDINIFKYMVKHYGEQYFVKPFSVHYIFNERNYSIGFKSKSVKDKFDSGVKYLQESGSYQVIMDNYLHSE